MGGDTEMASENAARRLRIEGLGHRGDGIADGPVFVPYTLPGEVVEARVEGDRGDVLRLIETSPAREAPFCPHFGECGGCATQHFSDALYRDWKRNLVVAALRQQRIEADVALLLDAHGAGRRRATLHARRGRIGFARARSHDIVDLDECPLFAPALQAAMPALRAIGAAAGVAGKPVDLLATATMTGLDLDLRGLGRLAERHRLRLGEMAARFDLARLSNHGEIILERRAPLVRLGPVEVSPPPGGFLQASVAADEILAGLVVEGVAGARRVADLFCGCGTFAFPLATASTVTAIDGDRAAITALDRAARKAQGIRPVSGTVRDLFNRPMLADELKAFDAVVFDPPRAGAEAQARRLAASKVGRVIAVSCNPATFARDAALLIAGGYRPERIVPVDQFRHGAHVEIVATFSR